MKIFVADDKHLTRFNINRLYLLNGIGTMHVRFSVQFNHFRMKALISICSHTIKTVDNPCTTWFFTFLVHSTILYPAQNSTDLRTFNNFHLAHVKTTPLDFYRIIFNHLCTERLLRFYRSFDVWWTIFLFSIPFMKYNIIVTDDTVE